MKNNPILHEKSSHQELERRKNDEVVLFDLMDIVMVNNPKINKKIIAIENELKEKLMGDTEKKRLNTLIFKLRQELEEAFYLAFFDSESEETIYLLENGDDLDVNWS